ncbi:hypothetical protein BDZ85DRAFT_301791 [Elsinoe ampelina]|uniref:2EXR domain-containing protein n=1 Tax=Elsinoe ampelina TaxID=302913 RepID=A0A6A6G716_9PEZI|nr:hypothetical protein BDZ85DRAFT_301791 [Elsinoe ampelina]
MFTFSSLHHIMQIHNPTFSLFSRLPKEIRLQIWRHCLPYRVIELDKPDENDICFDEPFAGDRTITRMNALPPCLTRVCAEARGVAFETGSLQRHPFVYGLGRDYYHDDYPEWATSYSEPLLWMDPRRDRILTHYTRTTQFEMDRAELPGDPIKYAIHHASHLENAEPSIFWALIDQYLDFHDPDERGDFSRWSTRQLADIIRTVPSWTVVVGGPIFVFAEPGELTGFFGLLDDAPVQIVDAYDKALLCSYLSLGEMPGITVSMQISAVDVEDAIVRVQESIAWLFGSQHDTPVFHPAVMFRLFRGQPPKKRLTHFASEKGQTSTTRSLSGMS